MLIHIDPSLPVTLLSVVPLIFGSIAGIFAAAAQRRAAQEAMRILNEAREAGTKEAKAISAMFDPFVSSGGERLGTSFDVIKRLTETAEAGAQEGLTAADRLSLEDAQRLLNENLVGTGNLRSGTAAFQGAEVGRRVLADASNRRLQFLQLAFGGATGLGNIAGATGQLGLGGKTLSANLLGQVMGLAAPTAQTAMAKGAAEAAGIQAWGSLGDQAVNIAMGAAGGPGGMLGSAGIGPGGLGGAFLGAGGTNFSQLFAAQQLAPLFSGIGGQTTRPKEIT